MMLPPVSMWCYLCVLLAPAGPVDPCGGIAPRTVVGLGEVAVEAPMMVWNSMPPFFATLASDFVAPARSSTSSKTDRTSRLANPGDERDFARSFLLWSLVSGF
jgi:hypothetical protein